jgi:hypothetical protein
MEAVLVLMIGCNIWNCPKHLLQLSKSFLQHAYLVNDLLP